MDPEQILSRYEWEGGRCFRHPAKGTVLTAHVKTIRPPAGGIQDIRACRDCVLAMEARREKAAARQGIPYSPGGAGDGYDAE